MSLLSSIGKSAMSIFRIISAVRNNHVRYIRKIVFFLASGVNTRVRVRVCLPRELSAH